MRDLAVVDRFWAKVRKAEEGECWEWTAAKCPLGYGRFRLGKTGLAFAHRVAFTLVKGYIPPGWLVLHSCDNPSCVNPEHLSLGTHEDNTVDMVKKGRHGTRTQPETVVRGARHYSRTNPELLAYGDRNGSRRHPEAYVANRVRGERVGTSKLTQEQVLEIREAYKLGVVLQRELGARYGVSNRTISKITRGERWKQGVQA